MKNSPERKQPLWFRICKYSMTFVLTVIIIGMLAGCIIAGAAAGFVASLVKDQPIPSKAELAQDIQEFTQTSYLYDRHGEPIGSGELRTANDRDLVELDDVSPYIIDAVISTEDKEFFEHNGIVPRSLLRAAFQDLSGSSTSTGGSTITQQLVKLSVLKNPEQTYMRKAREIFLALRLERLFDKEDILTSYLNRVYFGQGVSHEHLYGIEAASQGLFGVSAKEVNLAQAAYLAGIPQRPNGYSPLAEDTLKAGLERQHTVLSRMLENGKITKKQFDEAKAFDINASLTEPVPYTYEEYPYLFEAIQKRAAEKLMKLDQINPDELKPEKYDRLLAEYKTRLAEGGYHIHTTIDLKLYDALNNAVREYEGYKPDADVNVDGVDGKITVKEQVGSAVIDVKTGALLAFVGGRDKENIKNRALDTYKQPGSSAKPLLAYGPGMANGILHPETILQDTPEAANVRGHTVSNYADNFHGEVTVREALKRSYNVAAIDAFKKVGIENGYAFIEKMNMHVDPEYRVPVGVLGVNGFSPEQMAGAYAMFANRGKFNETYLISRIEDANGNTIYEHEAKPKSIMSEQSAYLLTDVLRDVLTSGTGTWIGSRISNAYDIAGKTGTTQNAKDVWFVGYTPEIAMSVWVGYDYEQTSPVIRPNENLAKIMWTELFHTLQEARPELSPAGSKFKQPDGRVSVVSSKRSEPKNRNSTPVSDDTESSTANQKPHSADKTKETKPDKGRNIDGDRPSKQDKPKEQKETPHQPDEGKEEKKPVPSNPPSNGDEGDRDDEDNESEPGDDPDSPPDGEKGHDNEGNEDQGSSDSRDRQQNESE